MSKWIIGDVHGCYDTLVALIKKLPNNAEIVFVGDLVDKGENSKKVIKLIRKKGYLCVLGNHEDMMIKGVINIQEGQSLYSSGWGFNGYKDTMDNYKDGFSDKELLNDVEWMKSLPLYLEFKETDQKGRKLIVSHAPCLDNFNVDQYSFVWNRKFPEKEQK